MSGNDWVGSQGDAPPDGHQMPRPECRQGELVDVICAVTDLWDEPLDEVHDVPPIVNAILASDWLQAHVDAEVAAALEVLVAELERKSRVDLNPVASATYLTAARIVRAQIPTSGGGAV